MACWHAMAPWGSMRWQPNCQPGATSCPGRRTRSNATFMHRSSLEKCSSSLACWSACRAGRAAGGGKGRPAAWAAWSTARAHGAVGGARSLPPQQLKQLPCAPLPPPHPAPCLHDPCGQVDRQHGAVHCGNNGGVVAGRGATPVLHHLLPLQQFPQRLDAHGWCRWCRRSGKPCGRRRLPACRATQRFGGGWRLDGRAHCVPTRWIQGRVPALLGGRRRARRQPRDRGGRGGAYRCPGSLTGRSRSANGPEGLQGQLPTPGRGVLPCGHSTHWAERMLSPCAHTALAPPTCLSSADAGPPDAPPLARGL